MARFIFLKAKNFEKIPTACGVYCFKSNGEALYVGKAQNLRERIKNHFQNPSFRDQLFLEKVKRIGYIVTNSEIEALILEKNLIKKIQPKFNIIWRDSKNYFFVVATRERFPSILITHQPIKFEKEKCSIVGPFVEGKALKKTLELLRKIFPFRSCKSLSKKPCFWMRLKRCPAPCQLKSSLSVSKILEKRIEKECKEGAKRVMEILEKGKDFVFKRLEKEIKKAVKKEDFERAAQIRDQIFALEKVLMHSHVFSREIEVDWQEIEKELKKILKTKKRILRIEAFDVSNIQGKLATASMVTFIEGKPEKNLYRKFKIKFTFKPNDVAMIKEVLQRRLSHSEWGFPDLILLDGGKAQLNAAKSVLENFPELKEKIKLMALAKRQKAIYFLEKKEPLSLEKISPSVKLFILRVNQESHRFAIKYHKKLREKALFK